MSPDITMCFGEKCRKKKTCYRFKAKPDPQAQSYFVESPLLIGGGCEYYWKVKTEKVKSPPLDDELAP